MFFSILIPVYQVENYLRQCVDSVLGQSEKDFEIVLVDDGSTDGSGAICDEYVARFPGIVRAYHQENQGPLLCRRKLLEKASGRFLLFIDSDDILEEGALSCLRSVIENTDADLVIYNAVCIHTDRRIEAVKPDLISDHLYMEGEKTSVYRAIYANRSMNPLWNKAIRKEMFDLQEEYAPWGKICIGEDLFQLFPVLDACQRIYYLDRSLYRYYKRTGLTLRFHPTFYEMRRILWEREDEYLKKWRLDDATMKKCSDRRISEINNFCVTLAKKSSFAEFVEKVDPIRQDRFFLRAVETTNTKGRYRWYCRLLRKGKTQALYRIQRLEAYAVQLKRKGGGRS